MGDFADARTLVERIGGDLGAAMVGLNPLHALPPDIISPYSPSSRLFHNPLYLHVENIEEYRSNTIDSTYDSKTCVPNNVASLSS